MILHIGLGGGSAGFDIRRITLQEITVIGTYTYTQQDFRDTAAAMFAGQLGPLDWTETRPLAEGARAFQDIRDGRLAAPKIILKPEVVLVQTRFKRPFQGWRYLTTADAPPDLKTQTPSATNLPPHLATELDHIGVVAL